MALSNFDRFVLYLLKINNYYIIIKIEYLILSKYKLFIILYIIFLFIILNLHRNYYIILFIK